MQAKTIADPFAYEEYRRNKIKEKLEEARKSRVQVKVRGSETKDPMYINFQWLTNWGQVMHICISKLGHHWFR